MTNHAMQRELKKVRRERDNLKGRVDELEHQLRNDVDHLLCKCGNKDCNATTAEFDSEASDWDDNKRIERLRAIVINQHRTISRQNLALSDLEGKLTVTQLALDNATQEQFVYATSAGNVSDTPSRIYTIGNAEEYRRKLAVQSEVFKIGRRPGYAGGSVWRTATDAWAHIDANQPRLQYHSVFELEADWGKDTAPNVYKNPWNDLLRNARITREVVRVV